MTEPELTEEELVLLAQHSEPEVVGAEEAPLLAESELKPRRRAPRRAGAPLVEAAQPEAEPVEPEPAPAVTQADDDVEAAIDRAHETIERFGEDIQERLERYVPGPEHPHAPPAQMDYGDPWGLLPAQMRHDMNGRHCP